MDCNQQDHRPVKQEVPGISGRSAAAFAATTLLWSAAAAAQEIPASRGLLSAAEVAAWRTDLRFLADSLPARHRNAFYWTPRQRFDSAVQWLDTRLASLQRDEVIVGLARVVATLADAHTVLRVDAPEAGFHVYPLHLYQFKDGLFIRAARNDLRPFIGAQVVRIGAIPAAAALDSVGQIIAHENPFWVRAIGPRLLAVPEVLHALHLADTPDSARFTVLVDGTERTFWIRPSGLLGEGHGGPPPSDWIDMRDATPGVDPLWLRHPGETWWMEYVAGAKTLYVCYRAVAAFAGETNAQFVRRVFAFADSVRVDRLVLDVRENGGGNGFFNRAMVRAVIQRPWLDQPDRFFLITGRETFSAAQQLVNDLEYYTNATLVGEPTGNATAQFGDARPMPLPRSGLVVVAATQWHQGPRPNDARRFTPPRLLAELTAENYRAKADPAIQLVLESRTRPTLLGLLRDALAPGDTALAARRFAAYRADPVNTYADVEGEANGAGYTLLGEGNSTAAIAVLRLNAAAFPSSPNVFDSLGDAYEHAGQRDDAIAMYRRALRVDPTWFNARVALQRLGAAP